MANSQDQQPKPSGWVEKKMPDGSMRYFPDDLTNDQINRESGTVTQSVAKALSDPEGPEQTKIREGAWNWLWTPKVSPEAASNFWANLIAGESTEKLAREEQVPGSQGLRARTAKVGAELLGDVSASMTAPGQVALTVGTLGEWSLGKAGGETAFALSKYLKPLLKMSGYTASAYFGLQGLGALTADKQEGETDDEFLERRILGATSFLGTAHAAGAGLNQMVGDMLVRSFGLTPELASKVATRVGELEKIRGARGVLLDSIDNERDAKLQSIDSDTRRQVATLQHNLDDQERQISLAAGTRSANFDRLVDAAIADSKGRLSDLQRQQMHEGSRIISETVQAIREMEGDRDVEGSIKRPFREIGDKLKETVATQDSIYQLLDEKFSKRGIQPTELPGAAIKALGKRPELESVEGMDLSRFPPEVQELAKGGRNLSFNDLTRIREDLYQAAEASKDANVAGALKDASESVSDLQEAAAEKAGLGPKYKKAKYDYMVFKRGMGSGFMKEWLGAEDGRDQDLIRQVGTLIQNDDATNSGATTRAIRSSLKAAGIDTRPLDDIVDRVREEEAMPKRVRATGEALKRQSVAEAKARVGEAKAETKEAARRALAQQKERVAGVKETYAERAKTVEEEARAQERDVERYDVIRGYKADELAGKSLEELYRIKLQEMAERAKGQGLPVTALVMTMYGLLHASAFPLLYGMTRGGLPDTIRNPAFQDWVIERAGIKPGTRQANQVRRALNVLSESSRRSFRRGAAGGALMLGEKERRRTSENPPTREEVLQQP